MLDIVSSYKNDLKTQVDTVSSGNSRSRILDAALALIVKRGGADVTMMEIAKAAGVSRQAVYLHFADRAELLVSVARHADEKRGLYAEIRKITDAPSGIDALREAASLQARTNPGIWAIARAVDAVRRTDEAAAAPAGAGRADGRLARRAARAAGRDAPRHAAGSGRDATRRR